MCNKEHRPYLFIVSKIDFNLIGEPPSSLIINFDQAIKSFLV